MEKKLLEIRDFVQSLENSELNKKQEAVLLVGESENAGLGDNPNICKQSTNSSKCTNWICDNSHNSAECTNYNSCVGADETATGGGSGSGSGGTAGAPGIDAGLMGFPGFNF